MFCPIWLVATGFLSHGSYMADPKLIALADLSRAADLLRVGEIVAVPTDTVYGLAVSLKVREATHTLFAAKHRPEETALPVMVHNLTAALALTAPSSRDRFRLVGEAFWPGSLTAIVDRDKQCEVGEVLLGDIVLGGDESTIGLRVPAFDALRYLCQMCGPLAVSSANLHGQRPCTSAAELRSHFGDDLVIVDGGICQGRVSAVVDLTGETPVIVREGEITRTMINDLLGS